MSKRVVARGEEERGRAPKQRVLACSGEIAMVQSKCMVMFAE